MLNVTPIPQPYSIPICAENKDKIKAHLKPVKEKLVELIGDYGNLAVENIVDPENKLTYWQISYSHKHGKYVLGDLVENLTEVFLALESILTGLELLEFMAANRDQP